MQFFKKNIFLFYILILLVAPTGFAQVLQEEDLNEDISEEDFYGKEARANLSTGVYRFISPHGNYNKAINPECHATVISKSILEAPSENTAKVIKDFFKKCGDNLSRGHRAHILQLLRAGSKYNFKNKSVRPFKIKISDHAVAVGFLALKDKKKRPLIVMKCGMLCNGQNTPVSRSLFIQLVDESPFHVLLLANYVSQLSSKANRRILLMGGWHEGQELIKVGQWLRKSKYASQITSLHLLGISLGGHASLYASVYNDHLLKPVYKSVLSYCPVVNLEAAMDRLYRNSITGFFLARKTNKFLKNILNFLGKKDIGYKIPLRTRGLKPIFWKHALGKISTVYLKKQDPSSFLSPFKNYEIKDIQDFWRINNFFETLKTTRRGKTPTLVFYSKNDQVIKSRDHALKLEEFFKNKSPSNFSFSYVEKGSHCLLSAGYGWPTESSIIRSIFIRHSPDLLSRRVEKVVPIDFKLPSVSTKFGYKPRVALRYYWIAKPDKKYILLRFIFSLTGSCDRNGPKCKDFKYVRISFNNLPFKYLVSVPKDKKEARALTRWLNANVFLRDKKQKVPKNFVNSRFLSWEEY